MSLESLYATTGDGPRRSGLLRRRLRLLQVVLPCFPRAVASSYNRAKRFNREFWTNFLTPCLAMEQGKWRFDRIDDRHDTLVGLVLQKLEAVVDFEESAIPEVSPAKNSLP
jgi:hypothetical protein